MMRGEEKNARPSVAALERADLGRAFGGALNLVQLNFNTASTRESRKT